MAWRAQGTHLGATTATQQVWTGSSLKDRQTSTLETVRGEGADSKSTHAPALPPQSIEGDCTLPLRPVPMVNTSPWRAVRGS